MANEAHEGAGVGRRLRRLAVHVGPARTRAAATAWRWCMTGGIGGRGLEGADVHRASRRVGRRRSVVGMEAPE